MPQLSIWEHELPLHTHHYRLKGFLSDEIWTSILCLHPHRSSSLKLELFISDWCTFYTTLTLVWAQFLLPTTQIYIHRCLMRPQEDFKRDGIIGIWILGGLTFEDFLYAQFHKAYYPEGPCTTFRGHVGSIDNALSRSNNKGNSPTKNIKWTTSRHFKIIWKAIYHTFAFSFITQVPS